MDMSNIISDIHFMDSFENYSLINASNALVIYIYSSIILLYGISLFYALRWDRRNETCCFTMEVEHIYKCCSEEEVIEAIEEVKELGEKAVEKRKVKLMKEFFLDMTKKNKEANIFSALGINLNSFSNEKSIEMKEIIQNNNPELPNADDSLKKSKENFDLSNHAEVETFNKKSFTNKFLKALKEKKKSVKKSLTEDSGIGEMLIDNENSRRTESVFSINIPTAEKETMNSSIENKKSDGENNKNGNDGEKKEEAKRNEGNKYL